MRESSNPIVSLPAVGAQDVLTVILRDGAQRLLAAEFDNRTARLALRDGGRGFKDHRHGDHA